MVVRRRPSPSCDFFFVFAARARKNQVCLWCYKMKKKIRLCARVFARQEEERCGVPSLHNPNPLALAALAFLDHT